MFEWIVQVGSLLLLLVICLEIALRIYIRKRGRSWLRLPGSVTEYSVHEGVNPSLTRRRLRYAMNRSGERALGDAKPAAGLYRVLVVGGSTADCGLLDQEETFGAYLEQLLGQRENLERLGVKQVHVGTIAASQTDSRALKLILERMLPHYGVVDLVVVLNGLSDGLRWVEAGAPSGQPAPPKPEEVIFVAYPGMPLPLKRPAIWRAWVSPWLARRKPLQIEGFGKLLVREAAARKQGKCLDTTGTDMSGALQVLESTTKQVLELLRRHSKRVIYLHQPWLDTRGLENEEGMKYLWSGRIGDARSAKEAVFLSDAGLRGVCEQINETSRRVTSAAGVEDIDLRLELGSSFEYYYDHFHFTPAGARRAAEVLLPRVLSSRS